MTCITCHVILAITSKYPKVSLSLSMKMCAQRMEGRTKRARRRFASLPFPSHGPLRFVTSHSRFVLASVQKTKRLRRKRQHCSCEIQRAVHSPLSFNLYIWASHP